MDLDNIPGFKNIEKIHNLFQKYYEALYFRSPSVHKPKGIFASKKLQEEQNQELAMDFNRLEKQSTILVQLLEQIAMVVSVMSDRLFERNRYRNA